jgi:DNA replication initiation complex subunit (GINS family)
MNTILKIDSPAIIGLFRKMTNEQVGKIIRAYLNNNPKDLMTEEEKQIYTELTNNREQQKINNKDKILKGWETRRRNGNASSRAIKNQLQAQLQKNKDEMIKLRTENDTLKKASKQQYYNSNWNNNNKPFDKEEWAKKQEEKRQKEIEERLEKDPKLKATFW